MAPTSNPASERPDQRRQREKSVQMPVPPPPPVQAAPPIRSVRMEFWRFRCGRRPRPSPCPSEIELGAGIILAFVDQPAEQFVDRLFVVRAARPHRLVRRFQHQPFFLPLLLLSISLSPDLTSRTRAKPITAAPASATPGLLRTKVARVVDQFVGILGGEAVGGIVDRRRRLSAHNRHIPAQAAHRDPSAVSPTRLARHCRALRSTARFPGATRPRALSAAWPAIFSPPLRT